VACIASSLLPSALPRQYGLHHTSTSSMTDPLTTSPLWMVGRTRGRAGGRVRPAQLARNPALRSPSLTLTMLRQRAEEARLLVGDDTGVLEVVDVTELEMLEGADLGEITLLDALAAKSNAALARCNLRDFLIRERDLRAGSPPRVRRHAQVAFDIAVRAATPPPSTGAA